MRKKVSKHILKEKREAARAYLKDPKEGKILAFDLLSERIKVPEVLPISKDTAKKLEKQWKNIKKGEENNRKAKDKDLLPTKELIPWENKSHIPVLSGLLLPLLESSRMRSAIDELERKETEILRLQQVVHKMQEWVIMIYANCEATYEVRKSPHCNIDENKNEIAPEVIKFMLTLVSSINDGKLDQSLEDLEQYGNRYVNVANALDKLVKDALSQPTEQTTPAENYSLNQSNEEDDNDDSDE